MNKVIKEIEAYNEVRAQLAELKEYNASVVFDYETKKGEREARSHIYRLRQTKAAVEKCRKDEKAASLAYGREVDAQAKAISGEIDDMIEVHKKPLDEIEQKEETRKAKILNAIADIRAVAENLAGLQSQKLKSLLDSAEAIEIDESFDEFKEQASEAKKQVIDALSDLYDAQKQYEDEQIELAQLRKEAEERKRKEREEEIKKEAEARVKREFEENAKLRAETVARREREAKEASEKRGTALKQAMEQAKKEKHQAELKAKEETGKSESAENAQQEKLERSADPKHRAKVHRAIRDALITKSGLSELQADDVVFSISQGYIPNLKIEY